MRYKLIFSDIDGTLLNDKGIITNKNMRAIRYAVNMGAMFVLASSRVFSTLKYYRDLIDSRQPVICCNGSYLYDENGKIIRSILLTNENVRKIIKITRDMNHLYYHMYDRNALVSEKKEYGVVKFQKYNESVEPEYRINIKIVGDGAEYLRENDAEISKITIMDNNKMIMNDFKRRLNTIRDIEFTSSEYNNLEIVKKGINKGNALGYISKYYGVLPGECIAIGNDENDLSMIRAAGIGVAVKNASDNIKTDADYITEANNNEDAIAEVINKFMKYN